MACSASFDPSRQIVLLTLAGRLDEDVVEEGAVSATTLALECECDRFLVDAQSVENRLTAAELVRVGRSLEDLGLRSGQKVALFGSPFTPEDLVFETVATQAGHTVRVFPDEASAVAWLDEPPIPLPPVPPEKPGRASAC